MRNSELLFPDSIRGGKGSVTEDLNGVLDITSSPEAAGSPQDIEMEEAESPRMETGESRQEAGHANAGLGAVGCNGAEGESHTHGENLLYCSQGQDTLEYMMFKILQGGGIS